jgi:hypothetical protein
VHHSNDGINSLDVAVASLAVFDRWETHPKRRADVRIIDTIILPFFEDPLFHNSMYVAEQVAGGEIDAYSSQDFSAGFYTN